MKKEKTEDGELNKTMPWRPNTIRINFNYRPCENKFMYILYKVMRIIHVTIWFYALPFVFLVLMYVTPIFFRNPNLQSKDENPEGITAIDYQL